MTCMTTKKKFEVENPEVVVLRNGRFAYRADCPWEGKNGKLLTAFKFCSKEAHSNYNHVPEESEHVEHEQGAESEHLEAESGHSDTEAA